MLEMYLTCRIKSQEIGSLLTSKWQKEQTQTSEQITPISYSVIQAAGGGGGGKGKKGGGKKKKKKTPLPQQQTNSCVLLVALTTTGSVCVTSQNCVKAAYTSNLFFNPYPANVENKVSS
jgi:hypothetical protein